MKKGDILFNWRSGSKQHVGKTAYFNLDGEWVHSSFILRIRPNLGISGRYLYYYLNHLRESQYFVKLQTYSINAKFNKSAINVLPTVLPKSDEQSKFVEILDLLSNKIMLASQKRKSLEELFQNLLHQLMTAQIRIHDIDLPGFDDLANSTPQGST